MPGFLSQNTCFGKDFRIISEQYFVAIVKHKIERIKSGNVLKMDFVTLDVKDCTRGRSAALRSLVFECFCLIMWFPHSSKSNAKHFRQFSHAFSFVIGSAISNWIFIIRMTSFWWNSEIVIFHIFQILAPLLHTWIHMRHYIFTF